MSIVDTRGQLCPAPLIAARKALKEAVTGEPITVITDNRTSYENISRYLKDNRIEFRTDENAGIWTLTVRATGQEPSANAEEYCITSLPHFTQGDFVIAFTSDKMGDGDEELGHLLMTNFIKAVKDLDTLPSKMVFYNKGVCLGAEDSPVYEFLREIQSMGVALYFCATCADHYSLREKIKLGVLGNMFEIAQIMASAGNVVKP